MKGENRDVQRLGACRVKLTDVFGSVDIGHAEKTVDETSVHLSVLGWERLLLHVELDHNLKTIGGPRVVADVDFKMAPEAHATLETEVVKAQTPVLMQPHSEHTQLLLQHAVYRGGFLSLPQILNSNSTR